MDTLAIIMAGGFGERFWPLSRPQRPKQLLRLGSRDATLLDQAIDRITPLVGPDGVVVATGRALAGPIAASGSIAPERVLAEPSKRNTLGCLCWVAANEIAAGRTDAVHAVLTADHLIGDADAFRSTVAAALDTARTTGGLVTLGLRPTRPETGYGYIELGDERLANGAARVSSFREKPDSDTALGFVADGGFLWNSGMFFWTLRGFLRELERAQPGAHATTLQMAESLRARNVVEAERQFDELPSISIDYALMENSAEVWVHEAGFAWDDLGAWDAVARGLGTDEHGNTTLGDVLAIDADDCVLVNESPGTVVAVLGVQGLVVVATPDAVLVCPKDQAQRVREIVGEINKRNRP